MPFLWSFTGLLLLKNADKSMVIAILISILVTVFYYGFDSIKKNIKDKSLFVVLIATLYAVFSYYYHGASSGEVRTLVATALFLLVFPRELVTTNLLKYLLVIGSFTLLFSTYYFSVHLQLSRGEWPINAIPHSTVGAVIVALTLMFLIQTDDLASKIILSLGLLMSISAVIMNQTRGVWLALIISVIILFLPKLKFRAFNWIYILSAIIIIYLSFFAIKPKIEQRIKQTNVEISRIKAGDLSTSIGIRLQLWMISPTIIAEHPVLGNGNGHRDILKSLASNGDISKAIADFTHYHNQYLDRLVKGGVIGFVLLLIMLIYPIYSAIHGVNRQIAIIVAVIFTVAGMSDVPFNHGVTLFIYLLLMFTLKTKNDEANC